MHTRALGLEGEQRAPRSGRTTRRDVVLRHAERSELVLGEVDATELPVFADVTNDVDQLQSDPERLGPLDVVGAVDSDARNPDGAGDLRAVTAQLVEVRVARLVEILQAAVHECVQGTVGNGKTAARIGEGNRHRIASRRGQHCSQLLQLQPLLVHRELAVCNIVDAAGKRVDGSDRPTLLTRQHHDPVSEVARSPTG